MPCGFYFFNHSSTTVVNGQTFGQWFKDSYIFDSQGTSPLVSGFYFDGEFCLRMKAKGRCQRSEALQRQAAAV